MKSTFEEPGGTCKQVGDHLREIDRSATQMFDQLVDQPKTHNGVTEQLKTTDQMKWVRQQNYNSLFYR